jgi:hypothetical protein
MAFRTIRQKVVTSTSPTPAPTTPNCSLPSSPQSPSICNQGHVDIWWGHTEGDGKWACDMWISNCSSMGGCYAMDGQVKDVQCSKWECYLNDCTTEPPTSVPTTTPVATTTPNWSLPSSSSQPPSICYQGSVDIWWGHTEGDGKWASDMWISNCSSMGGCYAMDGQVKDLLCSKWECYMNDCTD